MTQLGNVEKKRNISDFCSPFISEHFFSKWVIYKGLLRVIVKIYIECLLCVRHCAKWLNLSNPHNKYPYELSPLLSPLYKNTVQVHSAYSRARI